MNSTLYEMRKQRKFMAVWTAVGFAFICVFGAFTVFGLSVGIQLEPVHPIAMISIICSMTWGLTGMYFLDKSASKKTS